MHEIPDQNVVTCDVHDGVAKITLNRPAALNAINNSVRQSLGSYLTAATANPEVRVVLLRGAGERAFCAGADVKEFTRVESPAQYRNERLATPWLRPLTACPKPVVAAIHGFCLGGGLEIALACDIRIAAEGAVFGFPEVGLGLITGVGGSLRALRMAGLGRAMHLLLTGARLSAAEAERWGLVTRIVPDAELWQQGEHLATQIAAKPPLALRAAKEVLRQGWDLGIDAGCALETDLLVMLMSSQDHVEAVSAFREKRTGNFKGH